MAGVDELERRVLLLEEQVSTLLDQRRRLDLMQGALDSHSSRLGEVDDKLDILIDGQAAVMAILRSRGQE